MRTDAALDRHALFDHVLVIRLLLAEEGVRAGQCHADVELGNCNLKPERRELAHDRVHCGWHFSDNEVTLEADTVELDAGVQHGLGEVEERGRLRACVLVVVLIDVELSGRVSRGRSLKADVDIGRAKGVVEDIRAPSTIVIERP